MSPSFRRRSQVLPKYSDLRQLMAFSFSSSAFYFLLLSAAICRDIVADARHCTYGFACSEQARFSSPSSEFSFKMSPLCIFPQDSTHPASARCIFLFFFLRSDSCSHCDTCFIQPGSPLEGGVWFMNSRINSRLLTAVSFNFEKCILKEWKKKTNSFPSFESERVRCLL